MVADEQGDLSRPSQFLIRFHDAIQWITVCDNDKMSRRNREHVLDYSIDMLVAKAVTI